MQPDSNDVTRIAVDLKLVGTEFQRDQVLGGRYRVISLLGKGGMGVVYKVEQIFLGKELALKTIDKHLLSDITIRRFQQEARAAFEVEHPNIIAVHDFGLLDDQTPFLVMEIINGKTLGEHLKRTGPLAVDEAIPIFVQICFGLAYAHERGIVHRDIKPNNIMLVGGLPLGAEGAVKIVDFGIAKFGQHDGGEVQALTRTGEIFGSPLYMSPEQCAGDRVDHRADIYSLGCVLFETLTGTPPCVGENALVTMMRHQTEPAPTLREASLGSDFPQAIEGIVATMLAKSPDSRYQNLGIAAHDLGALKRGESIISSTAKSSQTKAQAKAKTISMSSNKFYALLLGIAVLSAAIAGISGYLFQHFQNGSSSDVASGMTGRLSNNKSDLPFSRTKVKGKDGKQYVIFQFPKDQDLGIFEGRARVRQQATGEVRFETSDSIYFRPSESFLQNPSNFEVFQRNDLSSLNLKERIPEQQASQIMHQVGRLTGLKVLEVSFNDGINNDALGEIGKLPKLESLSVWGTNIDGAALAKLTNLRQITALGFGHCNGASDLFKGLKHSNRLTTLYLDNDPLTAADYKAIGTIGELRFLSVNTTGMHNADLVSLALLTKLQVLEAKDCPLTQDAIPALKIMVQNGLRSLTLSADGFSPADIDLIKKMLPRAGPVGAKFKGDIRLSPSNLEGNAVRDFAKFDSSSDTPK